MSLARARLIPIVCLLCVLALAGPAAAALDYPRPAGPVGDYAKVIPPEFVQRIAAAATELWQKTGAALVVATIPSLQGESIEQAAVQLYQNWGIGKKGEDKGVLILIAPRDRRLRIEVGYGLEGTIPDALAGEIINQVMTPYLKKGQYGQALFAGAAATANLIANAAGVKLNGVPEVRVRKGLGVGWGGILLAALVFFWMMRSARRSNQGGRGGRGGSGALPAFLLGSLLGSGLGSHRGGGGGGFDSFGGGFGGFGGGLSGGGGASGSW
ncbi:MAG: TPM domain-containing protein [Thermodesulfobacteriota bacterium]